MPTCAPPTQACPKHPTALSHHSAKQGPEKLLGACSYLGFGLMAGRAAVLAWEETRAANPCVPTDHKGTYEYGGTTYELAPHQAGPSFDQCAKVVHLVLKLDMDCGAPHVSFLALQACSGSRGHGSGLGWCGGHQAQ